MEKLKRKLEKLLSQKSKRKKKVKEADIGERLMIEMTHIERMPSKF